MHVGDAAIDRVAPVESWSAVEVPVLAGSPPPLRLHDTATGEVRTTAPGATARMYVCGITPYDATHMGHAATYLAFDLVNRAWRDGGHAVHYVQNVTDIDDPLLERAVATGQDWRDIAARETELFRDDMAALRVLPPDDYLGAVESIPSIAEYIARLQDSGAVYRVDDDWYFDLSVDPRFGTVAGLDEAEMMTLFAERGGDPQRPGKRHPLDPLVWLAKRPQEPAWDTRLGHGRPGWHIECVAIALDTVGLPLDVQGGGSDLAFPHHEMGASHGCAITGDWPYARHFVHAGMVGLDGEKMSKSRGNLVFVSALRADGHDPSAIRLAALDHHYRSDWEWTGEGLRRAEARLARWRSAVGQGTGPAAETVIARIRERLADDLDAPAALAAIDRWAEDSRLGDGSDPDAGALIATAADALLGVDLA